MISIAQRERRRRKRRCRTAINAIVTNWWDLFCSQLNASNWLRIRPKKSFSYRALSAVIVNGMIDWLAKRKLIKYKFAWLSRPSIAVHTVDSCTKDIANLTILFVRFHWGKVLIEEKCRVVSFCYFSKLHFCFVWLLETKRRNLYGSDFYNKIQAHDAHDESMWYICIWWIIFINVNNRIELLKTHASIHEGKSIRYFRCPAPYVLVNGNTNYSMQWQSTVFCIIFDISYH